MSNCEDTEPFKKVSSCRNSVKFEELLFPSTSSSLTDFLHEKGEHFDDNKINFSKKVSISSSNQEEHRSSNSDKHLKQVSVFFKCLNAN